jgi:hypothetical protein
MIKNVTLILATVALTPAAFSQVNSISMSSDFKQISGFGKLQSGEALQTYSSHNTKGSQFFNENWSIGSVTTTNKEVINTGYLFLYDKVRQELFLKPKDSDVVVLADKNQIYAFSIFTDKMHNFRQAALYDLNEKGNFVEVLVESDNYSLLKLNKTTFEKANTNDMEKVRSGNFDDEFVDHITYYLFHDNKLQKIKLSESFLRKALKEQQSEVNDFFNLHENDEFTEQLLVSLVDFLNS